MMLRIKNPPVGLVLLLGFSAGILGAQTAQVRHAPTLNGTVEGSVQMMTAESITLNGGASVTGDLLVPGTPTVNLNGTPTYGGTLDGTGSATPANYTIKLNGSASLGHVVRRTNAVNLPVVAAPPSPAGTRSVTLNSPSDAPGDFATLKDLTLNPNVGQIDVPPGTYGSFSANAGSGFTLGVAGATTPASYNFQGLMLNSNSSFTVIGPVVVTLNGGISTNASMGASAHPEWLKLKVSGGGLTIAGQRTVYARLEAPDGTLILNGGSQFIGAVSSDRLVINGNALLRLLAPPTTNQPPTVALTAPANGASYTAPATYTLEATATDADGMVAKVEFYDGLTKLGEDTVAPFAFPLTVTAAGSYTYSARATDNLGATTDSTVVTVTVASPNQPPTITLDSPLDGTLLTAPATVTLTATATDADGAIARVEFYEGTTKLGERIAPDTSGSSIFTFPLTSALSAGTYAFTARAVDNLNASVTSPASTITVVNPNQAPVVSLTAPADGASFILPAAITLAATATDSDGTIAKVEFFQGAVLLGEDLTAPFTFPITLSSVGSYNFLARATDNLGAATDSAPVTITVIENPTPDLPYLAGFEVAEGYSLGPIDGQKGWTATSSSVVTNADFSSGAQSVLLPGNTPPLVLSHAFAAHPGQPVVFVDLFTLPQATVDAAASAKLVTLDAAQVAFVHSGSTGVFYVFNGNGTGGGSWQASLASVPVDGDGYATDWTRVTLRLDYTAKKWDLYVGGDMVAADLGLAQNSRTDIGSFTLTGQATGPTLMDEFLAAFDNPVFTDADKDGMDDAWETAHGLNPALNDRNGDSDGDGLKNILEYLLGTNPNTTDSDGDGMTDGWEHQYGLNPLANESAGDLDGDGVSNFMEYLMGRNPTKGVVPDTTGAVNLRIFQPSN